MACWLVPLLFTCLAAQINTRLCDNFSVGHYPMLLWGNPSKFVSGSWDPKKDKNEIRLIDDGRTAERLLNWINKQIGRYGVSQSIAYFSITIVDVCFIELPASPLQRQNENHWTNNELDKKNAKYFVETILFNLHLHRSCLGFYLFKGMNGYKRSNILTWSWDLQMTHYWGSEQNK